MAASLWFPRELHGSVEWIKQERTTRQQEHSSSSSSTTFMSATVPRFDASLPPSLPALHSKQQTLANVLEPSYWQQLNPGLHVGDAAFISSCKAMKPPKSRLKDLCQQINEAGVAQVGPIATKVARLPSLLGAHRKAHGHHLGGGSRCHSTDSPQPISYVLNNACTLKSASNGCLDWGIVAVCRSCLPPKCLPSPAPQLRATLLQLVFLPVLWMFCLLLRKLLHVLKPHMSCCGSCW